MNQQSPRKQTLRMHTFSAYGYRTLLATFALLAALLVQGQSASAQEGANGGASSNNQIFLPAIASGTGAIDTNMNIPQVVENADGSIGVAIPAGDVPTASAHRVVSAGAGAPAAAGSDIALHWEMFSWSTGELVESSRAFDGAPMLLTLGDGYVPSYLEAALTDQTAGSRLLVTFAKGMADLPGYFDQSDAYVLVVDLLMTSTTVVEGDGLNEDVNSAATAPKGQGCLGNQVYFDADEDGHRDNRDNDEGNIAGIFVELLGDNGNVVVDSDTTNSSGYYLLCAIPGDYQVRWTLPLNYAFTLPNASTESRDSDADPDTGVTVQTFPIVESQINYDVDAGVVPFDTKPQDACLGDFVWKDVNADGIQGSTENGVAGILINLWTADANGTAIAQVDSTSTNSIGEYGFCVDPSQTYVVEFVNDPNMNMPFTTANVNGDDVDSDCDETTGFTGPITLNPGATDLSIDCGLKNPPVSPTPTPVPPTATPTNTPMPPTPTPGPNPACFPLSAVPGRITFGYENMPVGSFVLRNGSTIQGPISGDGSFTDAPGAGTFTYQMQSDANIYTCGDFTVTPTPTPTPVPPTPTPTVVPPTPTPTVPPTTPNICIRVKPISYLVIARFSSLTDAQAFMPPTEIKYTAYRQPKKKGGQVTKRVSGQQGGWVVGNNQSASLSNVPGILNYTGRYAGRFYSWGVKVPGQYSYLSNLVATKNGAHYYSASTCYAASPIALDTDGSGTIERIDGKFSFDVSGNGETETLSEWFAATEGILIDTSVEGFADGQITGQHLFGDLDGTYADGFEKLALLDVNADGEVAGTELEGLSIWTDANSNAKLDEGELSSLASHSIVALSTSHLNFASSATLADGSTMYMEDLWFPLVAVPASVPMSAPVTVPVAATAATAVLLLASAVAVYLGTQRRKALAAIS